METNDNNKFQNAVEIDSFMDLTESNISNFHQFKLLQFPNNDYGITVTEYKREIINGKEVLKPSVERLVTYGDKQRITDIYEKARSAFISNSNDVYSDLVKNSIKSLEIKEGEALTGTVKNIRPSLKEGAANMSDIVIQGENITFVLRVKDEMKERIKVGQILSIQKTAEGLQAKINPVQKIVNQIKM